jgi:hypothetical protein
VVNPAMQQHWPKPPFTTRLSTIHEILKKKDGDERYEIA